MQTIAVIARKAKKHVAELNLFVDEAPHSDPFHLRTAIVSARIYIVLLTVLVTILIVFTSLATQSEVRTIRNPSQADYENLLNKNTSSLSCSCRCVTIPYGNFTSTTVDYHPVCSSMFVSPGWINRLFRPDIASIYQGDFRALASSYFQLLATFCSHANRSVQDALNNFHSETLVTPDVLLPDSLKTQIEVKSKFLQFSTENSARQLLQLVRNTTQANALLTALSTSTMMIKIDIINDSSFMRMPILFRYNDRTECNCMSNRSCSMPSGFFDIDTERLSAFIGLWAESKIVRKPLANMTGFFVGCTAVESLLQSTLECLFDWSCLETVKTFIPSSNITGVYPLNKNQTEFDPNTTIEIIINELFIENWTMKPSFSNYYAQCAPIQCTYTVVQRNDALYVLTKLLTIYGGLTATLRLLVPFIVGWWRKRRVIVLTEPRPSEYRYLKTPRLVFIRF
jgi:hypothetical protein